MINGYFAEYVERHIQENYGDRVSILKKAKFLDKWGNSNEITTVKRTIAKLGAGESHETYVNTNIIDYLVSDDNSDTQSVYVEGHTYDSGELTFVKQLVTLTGQTKKALTTPLARINRIWNSDQSAWTGNVYGFEDTTVTAGVPQTASKVHIVGEAGRNQTRKAATSISSTDYWILTGGYGNIGKKASASLDIELEIKLSSSTAWRSIRNLAVSTTGSNSQSLIDSGFIVVPKNYDVRMVATALSGSSIEANGVMEGYLARVIEENYETTI